MNARSFSLIVGSALLLLSACGSPQGTTPGDLVDAAQQQVLSTSAQSLEAELRAMNAFIAGGSASSADLETIVSTFRAQNPSISISALGSGRWQLQSDTPGAGGVYYCVDLTSGSHSGRC